MALNKKTDDDKLKRLFGQAMVRRRLAEREKDRLGSELAIDFLQLFEANIACTGANTYSNDVGKLRRQLDAAIRAQHELPPPTMKEYELLKAELKDMRDIAAKARTKTVKLLRLVHIPRELPDCVREKKLE